MAAYSTSSGFSFSGQSFGGLHSNIFRPPCTPRMSYGDSATVAASPIQDRPSLSRKRTHDQSSLSNISLPLSYGSKASYEFRPASPAPLANEHYMLDYKFDTPTLAAAARDDDDLDAERDSRWKWDTGNKSPELASGPGLLARERNGKGRTVSYASVNEPSQSNGWGRFVINLVGGVAGSLWQFCRQSAFSGFKAGAGRAYDFASPTKLPSPLPGQYPDTDFFGDFEQDNTPDHLSKRQHLDNGWVMVDHNPDTFRSSIRKRSSAPFTTFGATKSGSRRALSSATRHVPSRQTSYTGSPQPYSRLDVFSDAFADPLASNSTTTSARSAVAPRLSFGLHSRSPASQQRASLGSAKLSTGSGNSANLSPDAQRYLHRIEKQDRDADKSMRKMSRQVQDLIRQGQVALGTKYEIDGLDLDDGDDWEDAKVDEF